MIRVRVRDGQAFRRAGLDFGPQWRELSNEELSAEQLSALTAEPALEVVETEADPVQEVEAEPEPAPKAAKRPATNKSKAADDGVAR